MKRKLSFLIAIVVFCFIPVYGFSVTYQVPGDFPSIQSAINNAPDGSTINVSPGTYSESLGIYNLNKTLYIKSSGGTGSAVISGTGTQVLLKILNAPYGGKDVSFEGFTFTLGRGDSNFSPVTIQDAQPTFLNCSFENNSSPIKGGAVLIYGASAHPSFIECNFKNNKTDRFGGAVLVNGSSAQASFNKCLFEDNTNRTPEASNTNSGGALQFTEAGGTVISCIFRRNSSTYTGGALMIYSNLSHPADRVTIYDSQFIDNYCLPVGSPPPTPTEGGAMHVELNVIVEVINSHFENNYAMTGGAISNYRGQLIISGSVFDNNQAIGTNYLGFGGAIGVNSNNPGSSYPPDASLTISNTVIKNSVAPVGGGIYVTGNTLWNLPDNRRGQVTLTNVVIENCRATKANESYGQGGGLYLSFADVTASGLYLLNNTADEFGGGILINVNTRLTLNNSYIIGNKASSGASLYLADSLSPSPVLNNTIKAYNQGDATANLAVLVAIPSGAVNGLANLAYILSPYQGTPSISPDIGVLPNLGGYAAGSIADPISSNTTYQLLSSNHPTQTVQVTYNVFTTNPATNVTASSAVLNGVVSPNGLSTTYYFQWGTTTAYGNSTPPKSAGSSFDNIAVSDKITVLTRNTTYHYRIVATNSFGVQYGPDISFKTLSPSMPWLKLLLQD